MPTVALSGNDTVVIFGRVLTDLADQNCVELTFPNDIAKVKTGKNGNSLFALDTTGQNADMTLRILRASADDKFLNGLLNAQQGNFAGTVLANGTFVKRVGDGAGNITSDTYTCTAGVFTRIPDAKDNPEGDQDQSLAIYKFKFANNQTPRVIG